MEWKVSENVSNAVNDYKTIVADNNQELDTKVNKLLKDGWQPYGKLIVIMFNNCPTFFQTMVQYT